MKKIIFIFLLSMITMESSAGSWDILYYVVHKPKVKTERPPLIILLHGLGSNEEDLLSLADKLPENYLIVSARAPIVLAPGSYAWYQVELAGGKPTINFEEEEAARNVLIQFITDLKKDLKFNQKEVYLCGFSQGAIMSYSVGLTRPDLVKGIAILSGRLLDEVKPMIVSGEQLQKLKIFISHGTNDQTISVQYAQSGWEYIKSLGIVATYKEYEESHGINNLMIQDLVEWLKGM